MNALVPFEKDLISLVKNVKFRKVKSKFHEKLHQDIRMIRTSDKTMTFVDKTKKMHRLGKVQDNTLLNKFIILIYKK